MTEIFAADVRGIDIPSVLKLVSERRREKVARLNSDADKRLSLGAELLLIKACGRSDWQPGENGKPFFDGGREFSLSHCRDYAVCAVSDKPVGVDIERPRPGSMRLAKRFFTSSERESVRSDEDFCRVWTMKESYIKLKALRLADMASFSVIPAPEGVCFHTFRLGEYFITCCAAEGERFRTKIIDSGAL